MAKIVVLLHGQSLAELKLQPGREYFAGRSTQCDILLSSERGISRQHLKIHQVNGVWTATLMAKYGGMVFSGQNATEISLTEDLTFSIPPYDVQFWSEPTAAQPAKDKISATPSEAAHSEGKNPEVVSTEQTGSGLNLSEGHTGAGDDDHTSIAAVKLVAFLRVANTESHTEEIFKLEGQQWNVGRLSNCEVVVADPAISRKHFEIAKSDDGYFITDHGSSNGTILNGTKIEARNPVRIVSGDKIQIRHLEITFEIRDLSFEKKLMQLPVPATDYAPADAQKAGGVMRMPSTDISDRLRNFKPNRIQIVGVGLVVILLVALMSGTNDKGKNQDQASSSPQDGSPSVSGDASAMLSGEKLKEARDTFFLAKNYYLQRKYSMCISQVEKLHSIVPFYENSKEIDSLCHQALDLERFEEDRRRREEARAEVENKIQKVVLDCKTKVTSKTTSEELNNCLQPAIELAPEHSTVVELQTEVKVREEQIRQTAIEKENEARRRSAGLNVYERALNLLKSGQLKPALSEFQQFVRGRYTQLPTETESARRQIASIQQKLSDVLNQKIQVCKSAFEKRDLKQAVEACDRVLKESPDQDEAKTIRKRALSELQREMKEIYENSVLEESLGNIEAAKEKWSKIVESSIPQDSYYQKAKQKLKHYGIGM